MELFMEPSGRKPGCVEALNVAGFQRARRIFRDTDDGLADRTRMSVITTASINE
jgi:hypothetical protein